MGRATGLGHGLAVVRHPSCRAAAGRARSLTLDYPRRGEPRPAGPAHRAKGVDARGVLRWATPSRGAGPCRPTRSSRGTSARSRASTRPRRPGRRMSARRPVVRFTSPRQVDAWLDTLERAHPDDRAAGTHLVEGERRAVAGLEPEPASRADTASTGSSIDSASSSRVSPSSMPSRSSSSSCSVHAWPVRDGGARRLRRRRVLGHRALGRDRVRRHPRRGRCRRPAPRRRRSARAAPARPPACGGGGGLVEPLQGGEHHRAVGRGPERRQRRAGGSRRTGRSSSGCRGTRRRRGRRPAGSAAPPPAPAAAPRAWPRPP